MAASDQDLNTFIDNPELFSRVESAIDGLRPFFEADQGDIRLVGIDEKLVARVRLLGACKTCSMNDLTLRAGVEDAVKKAAPEITSVEPID